MTGINYLIQQYPYIDKQFIAILDTSKILRSDLGSLVASEGVVLAFYFPGEMCRYFTKIFLPQKLSLPVGKHKLIEHQVLESPPTSRFRHSSQHIDLSYQRSAEVPDTAQIKELEHEVKLSNLRPDQVELFIEAIGWNLSDD